MVLRTTNVIIDRFTATANFGVSTPAHGLFLQDIQRSSTHSSETTMTALPVLLPVCTESKASPACLRPLNLCSR